AADPDRRRIMVSPFFRWRILYTSRRGSVPSTGFTLSPLPDGLGQRDGLRLRQGGLEAEGGAVLLPEQHVARHREPLLARRGDERELVRSGDPEGVVVPHPDGLQAGLRQDVLVGQG